MVFEILHTLIKKIIAPKTTNAIPQKHVVISETVKARRKVVGNKNADNSARISSPANRTAHSQKTKNRTLITWKLGLAGGLSKEKQK